jgi:mono/diheme cytochrome c family protein
VPFVCGAAFLPGCSTRSTLVTPDPHLERMLEQPKVLPYDEDPAVQGAAAMRWPPPGTLPWREHPGTPLDAPLLTGADHGRYLERIPIPVTRDLLETGRRGFDVVCATCHGVTGDGECVVAEKMFLQRPPSLHKPPYRDYPPGRIYATVTEGYGLMPAYRDVLDPEERWAIAAYVGALRLSRLARVADLPARVRDELAREAP